MFRIVSIVRCKTYIFRTLVILTGANDQLNPLKFHLCALQCISPVPDENPFSKNGCVYIRVLTISSLKYAKNTYCYYTQFDQINSNSLLRRASAARHHCTLKLFTSGLTSAHWASSRPFSKMNNPNDSSSRHLLQRW